MGRRLGPISDLHLLQHSRQLRHHHILGLALWKVCPRVWEKTLPAIPPTVPLPRISGGADIYRNVHYPQKSQLVSEASQTEQTFLYTDDVVGQYPRYLDQQIFLHRCVLVWPCGSRLSWSLWIHHWNYSFPHTWPQQKTADCSLSGDGNTECCDSNNDPSDQPALSLRRHGLTTSHWVSLHLVRASQYRPVRHLQNCSSYNISINSTGWQGRDSLETES